jgi:hypothetical protein
MTAMGMVELRVDHVSDQTRNHGETGSQKGRRQTCGQSHGQNQTCVSRTGARHTARHLKPDGRGALMFCRCFMFQMFHPPPPSRARDSPSYRDRALCKALSKSVSVAPPLMNPVERQSDRPKKGETRETRNMSSTRSHEKSRA